MIITFDKPINKETEILMVSLGAIRDKTDMQKYTLDTMIPKMYLCRVMEVSGQDVHVSGYYG